MARLSLPSWKFFIIHLKNHATRMKEPADVSKHQFTKWKVNYASHSCHFSVVWIQGTVVQSSDDGSEIFVDDGTEVARIIDCTKLPSQFSHLKKGQYGMIIGELLACHPYPIIRVIKLQDLTYIPEAETTWMLEVIDQNVCLKHPCDKRLDV